MPMPIWRRLLRQQMRLAFSLAPASAGNSSAANMEMIAITTSNSMRVKPPQRGRASREVCAGRVVTNIAICPVLRITPGLSLFHPLGREESVHNVGQASRLSLNLHLLLRARLPAGNLVPAGKALPEIGFSALLIRAPM